MGNAIRRGVFAVVMLGACGGGGEGDGESTEPLLSGSVAGSYEGRTFTAINGFTAVITEGNQSQEAIGLSNGLVFCGIEESNEPPTGLGVIIRATAFVMGSQTVAVSVFEGTGGDYSAYGSTGTLDVTALSETSISATVSFSATIEEMMYTANGTFEVARCP